MPFAEGRLGDVLDALDGGLVVLDADLRISGWNSWMVGATGVPAEAALGKPLGEVTPTAAVAKLNAAAEDVLQGGASRILTYLLHPALLPLRTRAGRPLIHNVILRPIGDKPNRRCLLQVTDVTIVAEREQVLRQRQNARYDAVLESAPDPIVTMDAEGLIQVANTAAELQLGYPMDELIARPMRAFIEDPESWDRAWSAVLEGQAVRWPVELVVRKRDGSAGYFDASASRWQSNSQRFVTAVLRNVEDRRTAEAALRQLNETLETRVVERTAELERAHEQLRQSQKMEAIGQLTGGIAHDFNNLLTPILGGLDILRRRGMPDERAQRLVDGALQSAERARTLVQRLLAFARRQPLQATALDVTEVVHDMMDLLGGTLGPRVRMVSELPTGLPLALADRNQLEMALLNLAVNARDAMPEGGVLTLTTRAAQVGRHPRLRPGQYVVLSVSDTGTGMDAATLARAIEPFFSTKGVGKGTGLGLSMIHGLAAQLGGSLEIASTPGVGTTVEVWLPTAANMSANHGPAERPAEEPAQREGVVLLVDDEELIRATTAQMLADLGLKVIEAGSAKEALERLDQPGLRLLITDHLMPGMTGTELARHARSLRPGLPILVISGFAELEELAPDLPRLMKPFREDELSTALNDLKTTAA